MKTFQSLKEIQPYFNSETNTYDFSENGICFDVCIAFDLSIDSDINACNITALDIDACNIDACNIDACNIDACNIDACNIDAWDITAWNITAQDINAWNITALDIIFYAVCFAYKTFICKSITGRRENAKYFCLDSEVEIKEVKEWEKK